MQPADLKIGQWGRILSLSPIKSPYRKRLIALGLLPGTAFQMVRRAPLGDPFEIAVRGVSLLLRRQEASIITVELLCLSR